MIHREHVAEDDRCSAVEFTSEQREWLAQQFEAMTTEVEIIRPSDWAEKYRYLPPSVTAMPGPYRFSVAPYLREIVDCLSVDSPVREVTWMKGAQICATVGVLENAIGYLVQHVKNAPVMMVTADAELATARVESNIIPMINYSGLSALIVSSDENNPRKTGKTDRKIEWEGGGYLVPFGAQNANKLRSVSIQFLLRDEIDGWPDVVGKDGDPMRLSKDRTNAYEATRKILDLSTPLVKGQSKIEERFLSGDQRRYFVCCLSCGFPQELRWNRVNAETGEVTGIVWETSDGNLIEDSVRYLCCNCGHPHTNDDKTRLLSPDYGAEWRPTATARDPNHRSYHLSALYSPPGMQTWAACVRSWLDAWDPETNSPRDVGKLQVFYNNVLGEPFKVFGEKLRFEVVSKHRRHAYTYGTVPNKWAASYCDGPVALLTCSVDVHKTNLKAAVFGWCRDRRAILVDYHTFEGDPSQLDDPGTWGELRRLIEDREYRADDGKQYHIEITLIDSGYLTDQVYRFCGEYESGCFPSKGRDPQSTNIRDKEFTEFTTPNGLRAFAITVNFYKDRWSAALRKEWDGQGLQPINYFNAPLDVTDDQLRELTVETKREIIDKSSGKRRGFEWHRPSGAKNELWDLLVYNNAAVDLIAWSVCKELGLEFTNWAAFWDHCFSVKPYFAD